jgi:D-glucosaminate-6-phosphate ammonia-lyase
VSVSGHWDLAIEYFTSTSHHRLYLQQEGNWITGMHQSDFSQQPIVGTIEGDQVKLRSEVRQPGDSIPFLFAGQVADESIAGSLFLGEYLTAQFSATRTVYQPLNKAFAIPGGPPLAT